MKEEEMREEGARGKGAAHPAKFSPTAIAMIHSILRYLWNDDICADGRTRVKKVLDPFAGVGTVHQLHGQIGNLLIRTYGIEIEPEWAEQSPRTIIGDAQNLHELYPHIKFEAIVTSPTFGNRMADHHDARDGSKRITYRHMLGRELNPNNSGRMQWGKRYRKLHERVWAACTEATKPDALFVLNMKNHIRDGVEIDVLGWHTQTLEELGWKVHSTHEMFALGMRYGSNSDVRLPEYVRVFVKS
ncbi:MAG: hypothetical protein KatS3mg015_2919 [Fimbriimonadales bacterium]|nr:MAG: hypothetical protein KatS3mg015_2919 [Fimbriimonadales bacterium]